MSAKSKYFTLIIFAVTLFACAYILSLFWPGPAIDAQWPSYWPLVRNIENSLIFTGALILSISGAFGYIYRDLISGERGFIMYFLPFLLGCPIVLLSIYVYLSSYF